MLIRIKEFSPLVRLGDIPRSGTWVCITLCRSSFIRVEECGCFCPKFMSLVSIMRRHSGFSVVSVEKLRRGDETGWSVNGSRALSSK